MKQLFKLTMPFAVVLLTACGNDGTTAKKENTESHDMTSMQKEQASAQQTGGPVTIKDDNLNAVYQHYIHLTTALVNADVAEAKIAANAIEAGAGILDGGASIGASATKLTTASNIEVQRKAYEKLSSDMIALVKKAGVKNGELYVEYCPMAFDDKGAAWLSSSKEIRNPYFGDKMLTCGEVKETIK